MLFDIMSDFVPCARAALDWRKRTLTGSGQSIIMVMEGMGTRAAMAVRKR